MSARFVNADLHSHSLFSDGSLAPSKVAELAWRRGVQLWALTDHDEVAGIASARETARGLEMPFVAGVEISVTWADETIHIVGLHIDETQADLVAGLEQTRRGRYHRGLQMARLLADQGIPDAFAGAMKFVGNEDLISRTHFARFLVDEGHVRDVGEAFSRYLADGRPAFVSQRWAKLADAIGWIRAAGGVAVVAHPGRYRLDDTAMHAFLSEFRDLGGDGIEVVSGSHRPHHYEIYAARAREFGFRASRGSDYHGPGISHTELGNIAELPLDLTPIWSDWI